MHKSVACHSAVFSPWLGYIYKMYLADVFVILDDTQMLRGRGIGYRNYINLNNQKHLLSVPILRNKGAYQIFKDVKIDNTQKWKKKHLVTIKNAYSKAPYYKDYIDFFEELYAQDHVFLLDLNLKIIRFIKEQFGVATPLVFSSESNLVVENPTQRLIDLTKLHGGSRYISGFGGKDYMDMTLFETNGIACLVYEFKSPVYKQVKAKEGSFMENLSSIDLLFNMGGASLTTLLNDNIKKEDFGKK